MPKKDNVYLGDGEQKDRTRFSLVKMGVDREEIGGSLNKLQVVATRTWILHQFH